MRNKTQKLHNHKKRTPSSKQWLLRHINDPYVQQAQVMGYRSRAAFKLLEIQEKYHILKRNQKVLDLGAAPGGWSQIASKIIGNGNLIAIDLLPMEPLAGVDFIQGDFNLKITDLAANHVNVILSDMAPATCGIAKIDHIRIMALLEEVYEFSCQVLQVGGVLVAKIFRGGAEPKLLQKLKKSFDKVYHFKPKSSRQESTEMYLIAVGFHG